MNDLLFIGHPREENLALFAGGELGPLARWRIEQHLEKCAACQDVVADFFHLHSSVSELAELPQIDWNEFAQDIGARVRLETPDPADAKGGWFAHHPWQVGLATAALLCTIVVVRQLPTVTRGLQEEAPLALNDQSFKARVDERQVAAEADRLETAPQANPVEPEQRAEAPAQTDQPAGASGAGEFARASDELAYAGQARRNEALLLQPAGSGGPLPADTAASAAPSERKPLMRQSAATAPAQEESASRERAEPEQLQALADSQAAPVPAAPAPAASPAVAAEKESDARAAQAFRADMRAKSGIAGFGGAAEPAANEQRKTETAALTRPRAMVSSLGALRGQATLEKKADADGALSPQRGFTVLPAALEDPNVDVGVAADGWISVRSVDGNTGTITITDVYVP